MTDADRRRVRCIDCAGSGIVSYPLGDEVCPDCSAGWVWTSTSVADVGPEERLLRSRTTRERYPIVAPEVEPMPVRPVPIETDLESTGSE